MRKCQSRCFTLIELLIVIAIIGILASVIAVSFGDPIKSAEKAVHANDLRATEYILRTAEIRNEALHILAGNLAKSPINIPAKVAGSFNYVQKRVGDRADDPCRTHVGELFNFFDILNNEENVASPVSPIQYSVGWSISDPVDAKNNRIHCFNAIDGHYVVAVRLQGTEIWFCGSTTNPENNGYYNGRTNPIPGSSPPNYRKRLYLDCRVHATNAEYLFMSRNTSYDDFIRD